MLQAVNRFYDSYYFRPRVVWRIVREALWDTHERERLYHEAVAFLRVRAERWKVARKGLEKTPIVPLPRIETTPRPGGAGDSQRA